MKGHMKTSKPKPSIGRIVHYVSTETGEHKPAAITAITQATSEPNLTPDTVDLVVFGGTTAADVVAGVLLNEDSKPPGTWHWPEVEAPAPQKRAKATKAKRR